MIVGLSRVGFLFVVIFASLCASADPDTFEGVWNGKGTYILDGDMTQCSVVKLIFSGTKSTFTFVGGKRVCDKHSEDFYTVKMDYKDGKLFFNGNESGTYDGNVLTAHYRAPDGNSFRNWRMSMRREGDHLMYEESRTMDGETTPLISFAGVLVRVAK